MTSSSRSLAGCMRALIMVLVRLVQSPTYDLAVIFPFHACAESGRAIRAALPNRNNGASLWAELLSEVGNGARKPESGLGWCALPLSGRSGPESCRAFNDLGRLPSCATYQGGSSELEPTSNVARGSSRREWLACGVVVGQAVHSWFFTDKSLA